jgi:hypothetical protein
MNLIAYISLTIALVVPFVKRNNIFHKKYMSVILNGKVPSNFYLRNTMLYIDTWMLKTNYPQEVGGGSMRG